jgi:hypothetical protein
VRGLPVNTVALRRAAIRSLHLIIGLPPEADEFARRPDPRVDRGGGGAGLPDTTADEGYSTSQRAAASPGRSWQRKEVKGSKTARQG